MLCFLYTISQGVLQALLRPPNQSGIPYLQWLGPCVLSIPPVFEDKKGGNMNFEPPNMFFQSLGAGVSFAQGACEKLL